jgi:hypothetical protein
MARVANVPSKHARVRQQMALRTRLTRQVVQRRLADAFLSRSLAEWRTVDGGILRNTASLRSSEHLGAWIPSARPGALTVFHDLSES